MVAANLAKCVGLETTPMSPSSRLLGVMKLGLQEEKNGKVLQRASSCSSSICNVRYSKNSQCSNIFQITIAK